VNVIASAHTYADPCAVADEIQPLFRRYLDQVAVAAGFPNKHRPNLELGKRLGCSGSLLYQIRRGDKNVTPEHLELLAKFQGKSLVTVLSEIVTMATADLGGVAAPGSAGSSAVQKDVAEEMQRGAASPSSAGASRKKRAGH
jgi:transcriptional regulator with XRE-family HTH domain